MAQIATAPPPTPPIDATYEEKLERIRTIVTLVQNGASLADTLSLAKEGAELASACTEELDKAEAELAEVFSTDAAESRTAP